MKDTKITVLIAAKNEEKNIVDCIRSVDWADQVFVLDSQSTDETGTLAESLGAQVVQFRYSGGWPKKRNWGLEHLPIRNRWVLLLDADERVSPKLHDEMRRAISSEQHDGYYIRWKFYFLGRWMKHSWSHGWMMRLFRHGKGQYEDLGMRGEGGWDAEVHENVVVDGLCGSLEEHLDHNSNEDLFFWIKKQNEFSTWNAVRRKAQLSEAIPFSLLLSKDPVKKRRALKAIFLRLPFKPALMFIYLYILKGGFRDGPAGYYFCALRAAHELNVSAKVFEATVASHKEKAKPDLEPLVKISKG